jgi:hypothetical protein
MATAPSIDSFSGFFSAWSEMLFIAAEDGRVLHRNKVLMEAAGTEIAGTALVDLIHPEDRAAFAVEWARTLESAGTVRRSSRWKKPGW